MRYTWGQISIFIHNATGQQIDLFMAKYASNAKIVKESSVENNPYLHARKQYRWNSALELAEFASGTCGGHELDDIAYSIIAAWVSEDEH